MAENILTMQSIPMNSIAILIIVMATFELVRTFSIVSLCWYSFWGSWRSFKIFDDSQ